MRMTAAGGAGVWRCLRYFSLIFCIAVLNTITAVAVGYRLRSFAATPLLVTRYYVGTVLTGPSMKGAEEITTYYVVLIITTIDYYVYYYIY